MSKKDMTYQSLDALKPGELVINEAAEAVKDPTRTSVDSAIPEILGAIGGGTAGGIFASGLIYGLGHVGLSAAGLTSGLKALGFGVSMMTGVGVATAIVAVPAVAGYAFINHAKHKKLLQEKERLYKEALKKHDAIINELNKKDKLSSDRIEYLNKLNILLRQAINELRADLEVI